MASKLADEEKLPIAQYNGLFFGLADFFKFNRWTPNIEAKVAIMTINKRKSKLSISIEYLVSNYFLVPNMLHSN